MDYELKRIRNFGLRDFYEILLVLKFLFLINICGVLIMRWLGVGNLEMNGLDFIFFVKIRMYVIEYSVVSVVVVVCFGRKECLRISLLLFFFICSRFWVGFGCEMGFIIFSL